jgi:hypothetical protein
MSNYNTLKEENYSESSLDEITPEDIIIDAVIIQVKRNNDGSINCSIGINGDVRITEIETILRIAKNQFLKEA